MNWLGLNAFASVTELVQQGEKLSSHSESSPSVGVQVFETSEVVLVSGVDVDVQMFDVHESI